MALNGAISIADVRMVLDDVTGLVAAAKAFSQAASDADSETQTAGQLWKGIPDAISADALTPALEPLVTPATTLSSHLASAGAALSSAASIAETTLTALQDGYNGLVREILSFEQSVPGQIQTEERRRRWWADLEGRTPEPVYSWRDVGALRSQEETLRALVANHNSAVTSALTGLARQIDAITVGSTGTDKISDLHSDAGANRLMKAGVGAPLVLALTGDITVSMLPGLPESAKITWLESHTPQQISDAVVETPELVQEFWDRPPSGSAVAAWWAQLSDADKAALADGASGQLIGNLGGVPYACRDRANRAQLPGLTADAGARLAKLREQLAATPPQAFWLGIPYDNPDYLKLQDEVAAAERATTALADIGKASADSGDPWGKRYLIDLNAVHVPPLAAVSIGDLDTAEDVAYVVPGMNTILGKGPKTMQGWTDGAQNVFDEESSFGSSEHAVVSWIGYEAPTEATEPLSGHAAAGAPRLAHELDAVADTRAASGGSVGVSVLAHSYGTTVTSDALTQTVHDVKSVVLVGSAGLQTQPDTWHVDRNASGQPAVYATHATGDRLAHFGYVTGIGHHINPGDPTAPNQDALPDGEEPTTTRDGVAAYGVTIFDSSDELDSPQGPLTYTDGHETAGASDGGKPYLGDPGEVGDAAMGRSATAGHGYLDKGTAALYNASAVLSGHPDQIVGSTQVQEARG
jgi:hypothetical protein